MTIDRKRGNKALESRRTRAPHPCAMEKAHGWIRAHNSPTSELMETAEEAMVTGSGSAHL